MLDRDEIKRQITKQPWFQRMVDEAAEQRLLDFLHDDEQAEDETTHVVAPTPRLKPVAKPAARPAVKATAKTVVKPGRRPVTNSDLTSDQRRDINAWLREKGEPERYPSTHVNSSFIARYYAEHEQS